MRMVFILLALSAGAAGANEPVEMLGGYPVYGAGMPRSGLVVSLEQAIERLSIEQVGARKITGTLETACEEGQSCEWSLTQHTARALIRFDSAMPVTSSDSEAIVFGVLRKSDDPSLPVGQDHYYIVATSVMVKLTP